MATKYFGLHITSGLADHMVTTTLLKLSYAMASEDYS